MNNKLAKSILGLPNDFNNDIHILKKHYREKALQYHPDKNSSPDASEKFIEVQEAYDYLCKNNTGFDTTNTSDENESNMKYKDILFKFINEILKNEYKYEIPLICVLHLIINKVLILCEEKSIHILKNIDKKILINIYEIIIKNNHVFNLSESFLSKLNEITQEKINHETCYVINPLLSDLLENNLYKIVINNNTCLIPLWHHELIYDISGNDYCIKCFPIIPENMDIDNNNDIHVYKKYSISEILDKPEIDIDPILKLNITTSTLKIIKKQIITLKEQGIPRINTNDIYDITKKSDIIIHIELF